MISTRIFFSHWLNNYHATKYPDGTHAPEVRAYDSSQNMGESSTVVVTVSNPKDMTPPIVTVTSPANNTQVTNSQKIDVTATDNVSVSKIELYIDNVFRSTVTNRGALSYTWNTRKIAEVANNITVKPYDAAENVNVLP
ncbi:MAG: hypothetical protein IT451_04960 [Candidatus Brocadia sp.]|nr:hypothetical protein [Candidatus Brocadia sp.]